MHYTRTDKRAVNMLSLILLGVGLFLAITSLVYQFAMGSVEGTSLVKNLYLQRQIFGGAFVLCGIILHLALQRENEREIDDAMAELEIEYEAE